VKDGNRPNAVAVLVLRGTGEETQVLLLRRSAGAFAGAWTYVMGGVEEGERGTDAARRELFEETGLSLVTLFTAGALDAFYDPVRDSIIHVPFFIAHVGEGDVILENDVHDEHRWVTFPEAERMLEFASHRRVLAEVHRAFVAQSPAPWRRIR
jgi:dATP pyrophosphohydrolase